MMSNRPYMQLIRCKQNNKSYASQLPIVLHIVVSFKAETLIIIDVRKSRSVLYETISCTLVNVEYFLCLNCHAQ